jgi:hypothetical protein
VSRFQASADALAATLPDGAVVLNLRTKRYYSLNETGTRIWQLLVDGRAEAEIVDEITREYEVDPSMARDETRALIAALQAEELIIASPS